jgi:hypothetical protein
MRAGAASAIVRARLVASTEVSAVPGGGCEVLGPLRLPRNCPHLEYEITNPDEQEEPAVRLVRGSGRQVRQKTRIF